MGEKFNITFYFDKTQHQNNPLFKNYTKFSRKILAQ